MGTKGGSKKDLSDIIIRHECILKRWYREISYEIESLMKKDGKNSQSMAVLSAYFRRML